MPTLDFAAMLPLLAGGGGAAPQIWTIIPFAVYLLGIATLPLLAGHWFHHAKNQALWGFGFAIPMACIIPFVVDHGGVALWHAIAEYLAFIALLGSLYIITGGIYIKGSLAGTPIVNTAMLAIGTAIASFIGTTGAAMLLIRPLLRANASRERKTHIVVFFIFLVANAGGMLTPLGDPPLFLGFLRGVPFIWTFNLFVPWLVVCVFLLILFNVFDQIVLNKEEKERAGSQLEEVMDVKEPIRIIGLHNFLFLGGVVLTILLTGSFNTELSHFGEGIGLGHNLVMILQVTGMSLMAALAWITTNQQVRSDNQFTWGPIVEVAFVFIGIFVTMVPALALLQAKGGALGVDQTWEFFWATGILSSFLDNAPTYVTFAAMGVAVVNDTVAANPDLLAQVADPALANPEFSANALGLMVGAGLDPAAGNAAAQALGAKMGTPFMRAISLGAVFMGANTYIGNGPNFMVKAIAESNGVAMPSFFGYMKWSGLILIPTFIVATFLFV